MPRNETILRVFVASPSDVSEERKALESVVQELNKTWSKNLNLRLELIKWETDVYPGFGDYTQDVINEQVNDEYDIFIAIFWSRLGTPTKKSESGSVEEFERAYGKHKDNDDIDIMVYFKDQAIPPSKMDFDQLKNIQELKAQLGDKGGLYWTFDAIEDFESLLRVHLSKVAQKWASKKTQSNNETEIENPENLVVEEGKDKISESFEDFGLLDYIEVYEDRMSEMSDSLASMAEATGRVGSQFEKRTKELSKLGKLPSEKVKARKIVKLISHDMDRYSEILDAQIDIASKSREEAFYTLSMALSVYVDFLNSNDPDELDELDKSLEEMKEATFEAQESLSEFKDSLIGLPRLTVHINKSKRRAIKALDSVLEEIEITRQSTTDVLESVRQLKSM